MSRLPVWLRKTPPKLGRGSEIREILKRSSLSSVCEEALCPNRAECYGDGTATFLLLGDRCNRGCLYCGVESGVQESPTQKEINELVRVVEEIELDYLVLTMVTRDDLDDGGSRHIAETVRVLKAHLPNLLVEVLTSDFKGDLSAVRRVVESGVDTFAHNIETVQSVFKRVRALGNYRDSLSILKFVKKEYPLPVKSSIMVGLGESESEVYNLIETIADIGVDMLTIGQYFQPKPSKIVVMNYITQSQFERYKVFGEDAGIKIVESAPYVRSSYHASKLFNLKQIAL